MVSYTMADAAKDREECAKQLVGLATCLPVGDQAKAPTPDYCTGLKQVLKDNKKCLSLLHLDPNSPEAQVFYQLGRSSNQSDGSPAPSPSGGGSSTSAKSERTSGQESGLEMVCNGNCHCYTMADAAKDREECAKQLVGLATCLPVGDQAKAPTPDYCTGLKQVLKDNKKCLSLLHLDPNSPEAQVFYQLGRSSNQSDGSPAPSPSGVGSSTSA
nr:protein yls3 [Quercus suber]